jgi:cytochrome c2
MTGGHSIFGAAIKIAASLLLVFLALIFADWIAAKTNPNAALATFDDARGYQVFTSRCEVCHAKTESDLRGIGPNLGRIGVEAATRRPGLNGPEYILESIMDPGAFTAPGMSGAMMPANIVADLSDDDVRNLVAHVLSFGATPDEGEIAALVIPQEQAEGKQKLVVQRDVLEHGERIFRDKCQSCHSLHSGAEHLVYAPAVFGVGFSDEQLLRESIKHTKRPFTERYRSTRATLNDDTVLVGNIITRTPDTLVLLSTDSENRGEIITIARSNIRRTKDGRPMLTEVDLPPGLADVVASLTPQDTEALIALLKAFK